MLWFDYRSGSIFLQVHVHCHWVLTDVLSLLVPFWLFLVTWMSRWEETCSSAEIALANLVSQLIVFLFFFAPEQINWAVRTAPTQAFSTSTDSLFLYIWLVFFHIRYCIFSASNYTVSFRLWLWLKSDSYQDLSATAFMYCESHAFCWLPLYMQAAGMCFTPVIWVAQSYTLDPLVILIKSCTNRHQE